MSLFTVFPKWLLFWIFCLVFIRLMNVIGEQYHVDTSNTHTHTQLPSRVKYIPINGKSKKKTITTTRHKKKTENNWKDGKGSEKEKKLYHIWEYEFCYNRKQRKNIIATVSKNNNKIQWQDMKTKARFETKCSMLHFTLWIQNSFMLYANTQTFYFHFSHSSKTFIWLRNNLSCSFFICFVPKPITAFQTIPNFKCK